MKSPLIVFVFSWSSTKISKYSVLNIIAFMSIGFYIITLFGVNNQEILVTFSVPIFDLISWNVWRNLLHFALKPWAILYFLELNFLKGKIMWNDGKHKKIHVLLFFSSNRYIGIYTSCWTSRPHMCQPQTPTPIHLITHPLEISRSFRNSLVASQYLQRSQRQASELWRAVHILSIVSSKFALCLV